MSDVLKNHFLVMDLCFLLFDLFDLSNVDQAMDISRLRLIHPVNFLSSYFESFLLMFNKIL